MVLYCQSGTTFTEGPRNGEIMVPTGNGTCRRLNGDEASRLTCNEPAGWLCPGGFASRTVRNFKFLSARAIRRS